MGTLAETIPHLEERVLEAFSQPRRPMQREALRASLRARNATLGQALAQLQKAGNIQRAHGGFALTDNG